VTGRQKEPRKRDLHSRLRERFGASGDALFSLVASTLTIAESGLAALLFE